MSVLWRTFLARKLCFVYLVAVIFCGGAAIVLDVVLNDWYRLFYDGLASKNEAVVIDGLSFFILVSLTLAALTAGTTYFGDMLDALLRNTMSSILFNEASDASRFDILKTAFPDKECGRRRVVHLTVCGCRGDVCFDARKGRDLPLDPLALVSTISFHGFRCAGLSLSGRDVVFLYT